MTEMKGGGGEERDPLSERGVISHVCQLEDKPQKAEGLLGNRKGGGVLCTMRCVCGGGEEKVNCVCFSQCV